MNKTKNFVVNNKGTIATSALLGVGLFAYNRYQKNKSMKKKRDSSSTLSKSGSRTLSKSLIP